MPSCLCWELTWLESDYIGREGLADITLTDHVFWQFCRKKLRRDGEVLGILFSRTEFPTFSVCLTVREYTVIYGGMLTGPKIVWTLPNKQLQKNKTLENSQKELKNMIKMNKKSDLTFFSSKSSTFCLLVMNYLERVWKTSSLTEKKSASLKGSQICEQDPNL